MTSLEFLSLIYADISKVDLYTNLIWPDLNSSASLDQIHFFLWPDFTLSLVKKDKESNVINLRSNYERDKDFKNNF